MDFECIPSHKVILERVDAIGTKFCTPEEERKRDQNPSFQKNLLKALGQADLLSLWADPKEKKAFTLACLVQEKLSSYSATAASLLFVNNAVTALMSKGGVSPECKDIPDKAASGDLSFSFAMTEKNAGSDVSGMKTTAVLDGNDFRINGSKSYATGAWNADYILVVARTDIEGPANLGTSVILMPGNAEGLRKTIQVKSACNAHESCMLDFDNVIVPRNHLVGAKNEGWKLLYFGGMVERLLVAATSVGLTQAALSEVSSYLSKREQFGQPITKFQAIQHRLADFATELEAMRWLTRHAAWRADEGGDPSLYINMAKLHASETSQRLVTDAARMSGGRGYLAEDRLNQLWREVGLSLLAGGTSEIQRNGIARRLDL